uniref:Uncharacterized protein n=1 Tax=Lepeophtheirus salmonis TaxID=72036 RepID=A0A0K2T508_LEPSM
MLFELLYKSSSASDRFRKNGCLFSIFIVQNKQK